VCSFFTRLPRGSAAHRLFAFNHHFTFCASVLTGLFRHDKGIASAIRHIRVLVQPAAAACFSDASAVRWRLSRLFRCFRCRSGSFFRRHASCRRAAAAMLRSCAREARYVSEAKFFASLPLLML